MTRRRYKSKWHRYGTVIAVFFTIIGGLLQIIFGVESLMGQGNPPYYFIGSLIQLPAELIILYSLIPIVCGIAVLTLTLKQQPHKNEDLVWMVIVALLGILGGTLGGLIILGAVFIYLLLYIL